MPGEAFALHLDGKTPEKSTGYGLKPAVEPILAITRIVKFHRTEGPSATMRSKIDASMFGIYGDCVMMSDLDTLFKRFDQGDLGEIVARENVVLNKNVLLSRIESINILRHTPDWNAHKYDEYRRELLAYFMAAQKLMGHPSSI